MRLTKRREKLIWRTIGDIKKQIGITKRIRLVLTQEDYLKLPKTYEPDCKKKINKLLGQGDSKHNMIFVAVDRHKTEAYLLDTVVHELIHVRFPRYTGHGKMFKRVMKNVLRGKKYPKI